MAGLNFLDDGSLVVADPAALNVPLDPSVELLSPPFVSAQELFAQPSLASSGWPPSAEGGFGFLKDQTLRCVNSEGCGCSSCVRNGTQNNAQPRKPKAQNESLRRRSSFVHWRPELTSSVHGQFTLPVSEESLRSSRDKLLHARKSMLSMAHAYENELTQVQEGNGGGQGVPDCEVSGKVGLDIGKTLATFRVESGEFMWGGNIAIGTTAAGIAIFGVGITWCITPIIELICTVECRCDDGSFVTTSFYGPDTKLPEFCRTTIIGTGFGPKIPFGEILTIRITLATLNALIKLIEFGLRHGFHAINAALVLNILREIFGLQRIVDWILDAISDILSILAALADAACEVILRGMLMAGFNPCPSEQ